MGSVTWGAGYGGQDMDSGMWGMGRKEPDVGSRKCEAEHRKWDVGSGMWGAGRWEQDG